MKIRTLIKPLFLVTAITLPLLAAAEEHVAHVHGGAKLQVAIDGNTVTLMLESPMDSLVGFEHAASNDAEKASLAKLVNELNAPEKLFIFTAAAGCKTASVKLESPLLGNTEKHEEHAGHSDLDGEFVFNCNAADKLKGLTVSLFDIAANLHDLDVEVASPHGQTAAELKPNKRTVTW